MAESYLEGCEIAVRKDQDGPMFEFSDSKTIKVVRLRGYAIIPVEEYHRHRCPRCGESNPEHEDRDGCRDPDCPEQGQ